MIEGQRVLIIDGNRRTVDKLQEKFLRSGYEAEIALSASVGLSIVEERRMNVAVLSAKMGHEEDWQLVRRLKESDPRLRLVLFDGPSSKGFCREARRMGVTRFAASPCDPDTVFAEAVKAMGN